MASLSSLTINDTGFIKLPSGTTAQRPGSPTSGSIRFNTDADMYEYYDGTVWRSVVNNFPIADIGKYPQFPATNGSQIKTITGTTTNGWYWISVGEKGPFKIWVDMNYQGGGWHMVIANRRNGGGRAERAGGMRDLTWDHATGPFVTIRGASDTNLDCQVWVGMYLWNFLAPGSTKTVAQFVSTSPQSLNGTHTKRYRWSYTGFSARWVYQGINVVSDDTGTGQPGLYAYHAANGFALSTWDSIHDSGCGCPGQYTNNPWWYGCCWSGNYWGGGVSGSYADAPYWDGSGGDNHEYGAIYIK
jgi:hypothetical protein